MTNVTTPRNIFFLQYFVLQIIPHFPLRYLFTTNSSTFFWFSLHALLAILLADIKNVLELWNFFFFVLWRKHTAIFRLRKPTTLSYLRLIKMSCGFYFLGQYLFWGKLLKFSSTTAVLFGQLRIEFIIFLMIYSKFIIIFNKLNDQQQKIAAY